MHLEKKRGINFLPAIALMTICMISSVNVVSQASASSRVPTATTLQVFGSLQLDQPEKVLSQIVNLTHWIEVEDGPSTQPIENVATLTGYTIKVPVPGLVDTTEVQLGYLANLPESPLAFIQINLPPATTMKQMTDWFKNYYVVSSMTKLSNLVDPVNQVVYQDASGNQMILDHNSSHPGHVMVEIWSQPFVQLRDKAMSTTAPHLRTLNS